MAVGQSRDNPRPDRQSMSDLTHIATSDLSNADLAPTSPDERTWSRWNLAALWIGMSVCIPTYMLAAGMIAAGMTWWQAVLTVMLGNLIVLVPMILNGHGGTKYGVPFPVLVRASFGTVGAHVPSVARALVACGWFGIQTWIGGAAIYQIFGALGWINLANPSPDIMWLGINAVEFGCFMLFWVINLIIVVRGIDSIRFLETWAAPFLLLIGLALLGWAFVRVDDVGALFAWRADPTQPAGPGFWTIFFPQLTAMVGFWATLSLNIPDFTRYCRSQRDQAMGQIIGLPTTMTLFCFIGIVVTAATVVLFGEAIWNPVDLIPRFGNTFVVVISLFALLVATLSTNLAANVVSPANGFSNLAPRAISFRAGAIATCIIGIAIMPWKLLDDFGDYIFTWLIGYSALLGPIAGIMLTDYFALRRTRLDRDALYDAAGAYRGVNWQAMIALVIAVLPNLPGFINAATRSDTFPAYFDAIYQYAWFIGLLIAAGLYYVLMIGRAVPHDP